MFDTNKVFPWILCPLHFDAIMVASQETSDLGLNNTSYCRATLEFSISTLEMIRQEFLRPQETSVELVLLIHSGCIVCKSLCLSVPLYSHICKMKIIIIFTLWGC